MSHMVKLNSWTFVALDFSFDGFRKYIVTETAITLSISEADFQYVIF